MFETIKDEVKYCPICHLKVSPDMIECPFCTADLTLFEVILDDDVLELMDMEIVGEQTVDATEILTDDEIDSRLGSLLLEIDLLDMEEEENDSETKSIPLFANSPIRIPIPYNANLNVLNLSRGKNTRIERIPEPAPQVLNEPLSPADATLKPSFFPSILSRLRNDTE